MSTHPPAVRLPSIVQPPSTALLTNQVDITSIRELRLGQSPTDTYDSKRWLTIVYVRGSVWKVMHLIAHTDDVYELWVSALQGLVSQSSDKVVSGAAHGPATDPDLLFIRQLWPAGQKTLNEAAAKGLCGKLGLDLTPEALKRYQVSLALPSWRIAVCVPSAALRSCATAVLALREASRKYRLHRCCHCAHFLASIWPCDVRQ